MKKQIAEVFKIDPNPIPWPRMILCAIATTLPLVVGYASGHLAVSVYGALTGYLLSLNDHLGPIWHRLWVTTLTYFLLLSGFVLGFFLKEHTLAFQLVLAGTVYWLGLLSGDGAELERGILFWIIAVIIVYFSRAFPPAVVRLLFLYSTIAYSCLLLGIPVLARLKRRQPDPIVGLRESFRRSLNQRNDRHIHAFFYTLMTLASVWISQKFQIERGYWITITVLLVMKSDRTQSLYKTFQRLFGTACGVLICDSIILLTVDPKILIALVLVCVLCLPLALKRNYLIASALVTIFVVLILEMAAMKHGETRVPFIRLQATLYGCILSVIGTALSKLTAIGSKRSVSA